MRPKISVIIVALNEAKLLPRCLRALQNQSYPQENYEVILVDNGSTDQTVAIAKEFGVHVYSYTQIQGCGAARKYGALQAKGSILAFTDADCMVSFNWLSQIDEALQDSKLSFVAGKAVPDKKTTAMNIVFTIYDTFYSLHHRLGKPLVWGFNMAVKKDAYDTIKGVNSSLLSSDDWDLAFRLQRRFGKKSLRYMRDLQVTTSTRKQDNPKILFRYTADSVRNYIDYVIFGRTKAVPVFHVR